MTIPEVAIEAGAVALQDDRVVERVYREQSTSARAFSTADFASCITISRTVLEAATLEIRCWDCLHDTPTDAICSTCNGSGTLYVLRTIREATT